MANYDEFLNITQATITQDINEIFNDIIIIEQHNMSVAYSKKISFRYFMGAQKKNENTLWVTREFFYNSKDEIILIKILDISPIKPQWIPFTTEQLSTSV